MIIALVQIPLDGPKRPSEAVIEQSLESTKIFYNVKGLRRKYYLKSDDGGGGIYEFATHEDAEAWFNDEWEDFGWKAALAFGRLSPYLTILSSSTTRSVKSVSTGRRLLPHGINPSDEELSQFASVHPDTL